MIKIKFLIFILLLFFVRVHAGSVIAEVIKLRGNITKLAPGSKIATKVKLYEKLVEDTSILTRAKSFVRIKLKTGPTLSLGPKGKIVVVKVPEKKAGVISLLKGKLRSKVLTNGFKKENEIEKRHKLFLKTKTAAMGVRGTDFQTIYSPENNVTSLVTFRGEVAMAQLEEKKGVSSFSSKLMSPDIKSKSARKEIMQGSDDTKNFEKILESDKAVVVKHGQYSGTIKKLKRVSKPVKLNPVQLTIMYKNEDLVSKGGLEKKSALKHQETKKMRLLKQAPQEAPPEGFYNEKTGEYAPKAGGYVDLESALYVAPEKESDFDGKRKTYIPEKVGMVDKDTGQYIAPKNFKLDAKKGFIFQGNKKLASSEETTLLVMRDDLNEVLSKDVVLPPSTTSVEEIGEVAYFRLSNRETFTKHSLHIGLSSFDESLEYLGDTTNGNKNIGATGQAFEITWDQNSPHAWQTILSIGLKNVDYNKLKGLNVIRPSRRLFMMSAGFRFYLGRYWNLLAIGQIEQEHFLEYPDSATGDIEISKVSLYRLKLLFEVRVFNIKRFLLMSTFGFLTNTKKDSGDLTIKMGYGGLFDLAARYYLSSTYWLNAGGFIRNEYQDVTKSSFSARAERTSMGFNLKFGFAF